MSADLYIIAAGKGSRMNAEVPKALIPITDQPCLTTTLQQAGSKFDNVFVVVNVDVENQWKSYQEQLIEKFPTIAKNVFFISILSGKGDGHAVLAGLASVGVQHLHFKNHPVKDIINFPDTLNDDVVVMWGDVFIQHHLIFDELLGKTLGMGIVPAVYKKDPYVALIVNEEMHCMSVDFSKHGEKNSAGYHDQSVFRFDRLIILDTLSQLHTALWKGNRYVTPGGELSLLYAFHHMFNSGDEGVKVYETRYPTLSFNTPEEVASIQQEINESWKRNQS